MTKEEIEARMAELRAILGPKAPELNEKDHKLAHMRTVWEELEYDFLDLIDLVKTLNDSDYKPLITSNKDFEQLKKDSLEVIIRIEKMMDRPDDVEWFETDGDYFTKHLRPEIENSEMHAGDCTAVPASCMRCIAEDRYRLPSSVTWSKGDGYRMLLEYSDLRKQLTALKEI